MIIMSKLSKIELFKLEKIHKVEGSMPPISDSLNRKGNKDRMKLKENIYKN